MLIPLILSGGSGTRLWPISRRNLPKQFLSLAGSETLFQQTVRRAAALRDVGSPIIVASDDHRFLAAEQLQELRITDADILLEPVARNTAPAIAVGALRAMARSPESLILVLPADHLIGDIFLHKQQSQRGTALPGGAERRCHHIVGDLFRQRRRVHDHGVDATGLRYQWNDRTVLRGKRAIDRAGDFG